MNCPVDGSQLHQVSIVSHYSEPIIIDQCEKCGGLWFDQWELYKAKQGEAEKIEPLNSAAVLNFIEIEPALICPRDKTTLFQFTDRHFPKDLILLRCPSCGGIWLKRGLFNRYQKFRHELARSQVQMIDKNVDESIRKLISAYRSDGDTTEMLGKLGRFLSTPVDEFNSSQHTIEASSSTEIAVSIALNVLLTILRVLIRK